MPIGCLRSHCNFSGLPCFFHRLCPQAIAEALKGNHTVTKIDLRENEIGNAAAVAWFLAIGGCGSCETFGAVGQVRGLWICPSFFLNQTKQCSKKTIILAAKQLRRTTLGPRLWKALQTIFSNER